MARPPRYSEQFKADLIRLVLEEGYSCKKAAESVGVCPTSVRGWVRQFQKEHPSASTIGGVVNKKKFASAEDEVEHLRTENRRLRMEREILKKAAAFFANES